MAANNTAYQPIRLPTVVEGNALMISVLRAENGAQAYRVMQLTQLLEIAKTHIKTLRKHVSTAPRQVSRALRARDVAQTKAQAARDKAQDAQQELEVLRPMAREVTVAQMDRYEAELELDTVSEELAALKALEREMRVWMRSQDEYLEDARAANEELKEAYFARKSAVAEAVGKEMQLEINGLKAERNAVMLELDRYRVGAVAGGVDGACSRWRKVLRGVDKLPGGERGHASHGGLDGSMRRMLKAADRQRSLAKKNPFYRGKSAHSWQFYSKY